MNFATQACMLQNILLNHVPFNITFEKLEMMYNLNVFFQSVILLHAFRYLYIAWFWIIYKSTNAKFAWLSNFDKIILYMGNRRKLPNIAENLQGSTAVADPVISAVRPNPVVFFVSGSCIDIPNVFFMTVEDKIHIVTIACWLQLKYMCVMQL